MTLYTFATSDLDLMNGRPLDIHRWSEYPEVNDLVNKVYCNIKLITVRQSIGKKLLKVLLLDLYVAWCGGPSMKVMFSRDNNAYKAKSRYSNFTLVKPSLVLLIHFLTKALFISKRL